MSDSMMETAIYGLPLTQLAKMMVAGIAVEPTLIGRSLNPILRTLVSIRSFSTSEFQDYLVINSGFRDPCAWERVVWHKVA